MMCVCSEGSTFYHITLMLRFYRVNKIFENVFQLKMYLSTRGTGFAVLVVHALSSVQGQDILTRRHFTSRDTVLQSMAIIGKYL